MVLVSTYTSAKSWTTRIPLHSAVASEEWCQAKSSSTSKISDCMCFLPSVFFQIVCSYVLLAKCCLYSLHLLYSLFIIVNFTVGLTHIVRAFIQAFIANTLYLFLRTRTLFSTINSRQQQRSSVCPLNKGFMVHFMSWLVNVDGSGVAFYTHTVSEWF